MFKFMSFRVPSFLSSACVPAFLVLFGAQAFAQTPATSQAPAAPAIPKVEFDEAVKTAIEKNPTIANAATAIVRAENLLELARGGTRPIVSASVRNSTLDSEVAFNGGVSQPQNQSTFGVNVTMPILAPSRWAAVVQARDQIEVATLSTAQVRQQIAVAAGQTYLAIVAARRQVEVDERARASAQAHLDYANRRLEGGAGSRLNQLRAAQQVSTAEARLENTRLALRRSQEALGALLVADGPVDAGAEPVFDVPANVSEEDWSTARPDLRYQDAVIRAAERVLRDSRKDALPTANVSFDPQYITPAGIFQPSRTWRLTVSLTQYVYEGGQRKATTALRDLAVRQGQLSRRVVENQARAEIRIARAAVDGSERALVSARLAATQANEVLTITTTAFEVGATTNLEVIDAQRSARDAETLAAVAEDQLRRAHLDLLVAIGRFPR